MEGERYEDVFLLLTYPPWSSVKRQVPREKTAAEEGRKMKNQMQQIWEFKRWRENSVDGEAAMVLCGWHHLPVTPSSKTPVENVTY